MSTQASTYDPVVRDRDDFSERLFGEALGTFNIFSVYIGDRLGFYRALAGGEALTPSELAQRTNTHERYAREWLEHQATSCVLEAHGGGNGSGERHYSLPPGRAEVLADRESLNFMAPLALDQLLYGFSILHCLPAGMVEQPSAATGTVMRPDTLRKYAQEAGFSQLEILPIDNFFFRFYRLRP